MADLKLRTATLSDMDAVETVLRRSYAALLPADYPPSVLVTALPVMVRAQPALLSSGSYFVVERAGQIVGCGGFTLNAPGGDAVTDGLAHIRHVAVDPDALRLGVAARILQHCFATARAVGLHRFEALSTLTAVPFYAAQGFVEIEPVELRFPGDIPFPAIRMQRDARLHIT
ncbi:GNAT family N-acetyltransferase [Pontivivens insulae]|uniref:N-acetyltransferase domain-containing protein n=1 Tax=Pontivivens insulae TaxID=1639689 RepID=A0A2R8ACG6_9RHOB|nr:GNAT family N-acetyltransferase [Pontivivens insulae]RED11055.1 GNAT family acetyltransferase [Pontivivens insulae]SPF29770.1 hypothetical protein POI8812_02087 [Pontivivens insulae]